MPPTGSHPLCAVLTNDVGHLVDAEEGEAGEEAGRGEELPTGHVHVDDAEEEVDGGRQEEHRSTAHPVEGHGCLPVQGTCMELIPRPNIEDVICGISLNEVLFEPRNKSM